MTAAKQEYDQRLRLRREALYRATQAARAAEQAEQRAESDFGDACARLFLDGLGEPDATLVRNSEAAEADLESS
jgi:hypothetical protein